MVFWPLTRSPTWTLAMPAMPSMGETIRVHSRLSLALSRAALEASRSAWAWLRAARALSSSCWEMAFCAARGV